MITKYPRPVEEAMRYITPATKKVTYQPEARVLMLRYLGWLLETGIGENGETLHMG